VLLTAAARRAALSSLKSRAARRITQAAAIPRIALSAFISLGRALSPDSRTAPRSFTASPEAANAVPWWIWRSGSPYLATARIWLLDADLSPA